MQCSAPTQLFIISSDWEEIIFKVHKQLYALPPFLPTWTWTNTKIERATTASFIILTIYKHNISNHFLWNVILGFICVYWLKGRKYKLFLHIAIWWNSFTHSDIFVSAQPNLHWQLFCPFLIVTSQRKSFKEHEMKRFIARNENGFD